MYRTRLYRDIEDNDRVFFFYQDGNQYQVDSINALNERKLEELYPVSHRMKVSADVHVHIDSYNNCVISRSGKLSDAQDDNVYCGVVIRKYKVLCDKDSRFKTGDRVKLTYNENDCIVLSQVSTTDYRIYNKASGVIQIIHETKLYNDTENPDAYIVRKHANTWCSVRMGDYLFMLCVGAAGASDKNPSVLVMHMKDGVIVHKSDDEIIAMIRENDDSDSPDDYSDDDMMFDYARNEYI